MKKLPRGALFVKRTGQFGNYVTWKMLRILSLLSKPTSEFSPAWTVRRISQVVGMSPHRTRCALKRMERRSWIRWGPDALGRLSWTATIEGVSACRHELERRVLFRFEKDKCMAESLEEIVLRAMAVYKGFRELGWSDVQAREALIRKPLGKLERVLDAMKYRVVDDPGAYAWSLVHDGHRSERRCRIYVERAAGYIPLSAKEAIVRESLKTMKPLTSAVRLTARLHSVKGRRPISDVDSRDVEYAAYELKKEGVISPRRGEYFSVVGS